MSYYSFGNDLYDHQLDHDKLESLRESIKHNSRESNRWTYESDEAWERETKRSSGSSGSGGGKKTKQRNSSYQSPRSRRSSDFSAPSFTIGPAFQVIIYIILGAGLAYLIYLLFINSDFKANGKKYTSVDLEDRAPSEIPKTELERLLEAALADQNYREAVRIYYLFILKDLSEKKWIRWKKEKTNMHYINEMQDKKEYSQFNTIVNYFEFIWYGKREINQAQFQQIQPDFTTLLTKLGIK